MGNDYRLIIEHHGIKGQKWGVRRFQDYSGRLLSAGKKRYRQAKTGLEYATRDKGWTNENRRHVRYDANGMVFNNPSRKTKSNAEHILDAAQKSRGANVLRRTMKDIRESQAGDAYRLAKDYGEYATRTKGWGSTNPRSEGQQRSLYSDNGRFKDFMYVKPESTGQIVGGYMKSYGNTKLSQASDAISVGREIYKQYASLAKNRTRSYLDTMERATRDPGWNRYEPILK